MHQMSAVVQPKNLFFLQADVARACPSGILRVLPRFCGRGSCRDGLQALLRPGLVTSQLLMLHQGPRWTQDSSTIRATVAFSGKQLRLVEST